MIEVLGECGYVQALYGLGLSHGLTTNIEFDNFAYGINEEAVKACEQLKKVSEKLAPKGGGHNKFLESIDVWLSVDETRFYWSEADTYRLTTKQSESTMHKQNMRFKEIQPESEEERIYLQRLDKHRAESENLFNQATERIGGKRGIMLAKEAIVEGLLQKRVWKVSYMTLKNIIAQREGHRLENWQEFCKFIMENVQHPELLKQTKEEK